MTIAGALVIQGIVLGFFGGLTWLIGASYSIAAARKTAWVGIPTIALSALSFIAAGWVAVTGL